MAKLNEDNSDQSDINPTDCDDFVSKIDNYVFEDRITIYVEPTSDTIGGVQMCPALFVPDNPSITTAVKHIYSKLSASAVELDQGIPDLVFSLVSTNTNVDSNFKSKAFKGISRIVSQCGLWLVISGEQNDALSAISTSVIKSTLPVVS